MVSIQNAKLESYVQENDTGLLFHSLADFIPKIKLEID